MVNLLETGWTCARVGLVARETEVAAASIVAATAVPATCKRTIITVNSNYRVLIDLVSVQQSTSNSHIFFDEFIHIWKRALISAAHYLIIDYHKVAERDKYTYGSKSK